jgi:hypothetical protein
MFLTTLPFDYVTLLDPGDRVRMPARRRPGTRQRPAGVDRQA